MGVWPRECTTQGDREKPAWPADLPHGMKRGRRKDQKMNAYRFGMLSLAAGLAVVGATGCATKNYVRNQTAPLVDQANQLDSKTAANNRHMHDVDDPAAAGITQAQGAADSNR